MERTYVSLASVDPVEMKTQLDAYTSHLTLASALEVPRLVDEVDVLESWE